MRHFLRFLPATGGAAAVEFAILLPVLLLILVGAADLGMSVRNKLHLQAAANAGLQHAIATQGKEPARTKAVIQHELGNTPATVVVEYFCECNGVKAQCTASCSKPKQSFVSAKVSMASSHLFLPGISLTTGFRVHTGVP